MKKLEGLKNEFQFKKWSGSSVYANSKGQFHFIQIKKHLKKYQIHYFNLKSLLEMIIFMHGGA